MTLKTPSKTPLEKPESTTNLEPQLQLNLNQEKLGLTSIEVRQCRTCGEVKPVTDFHRNYSTYRNDCKECRGVGGKKEINASRNLKKMLGLINPPLGTPSNLSGRTDEKLVFDHEHGTTNFRGWITDKENTGIAALGDNLEGCVLAVSYFLKNKKPSQHIVDKYLIPLRDKLNEIIN